MKRQNEDRGEPSRARALICPEFMTLTPVEPGPETESRVLVARRHTYIEIRTQREVPASHASTLSPFITQDEAYGESNATASRTCLTSHQSASGALWVTGQAPLVAPGRSRVGKHLRSELPINESPEGLRRDRVTKRRVRPL